MRNQYSSQYCEYDEYGYIVDGQYDCEEGGDFDCESNVDESRRPEGKESQNNQSHPPPPPGRYRHHSMLKRINAQGDDHEEEIEVEWRKPSWKFAKKFESSSRPHRTGKQMEPYSWTSVTLGRHCYAGGCGEQLDLWNEGRTSEFSQFGSGITNYFKVGV